MEQMYLVEIFVDKVTIFASEEDENSGANKSLIIKIKFGPKVQFIIKEGQLAVNDVNKDDIIECDDQGRRKWSRTIRVGKSYLFPSYPDTVLMILSKFPLEIEVWNDDENETEIFVGIGTMHWDTQFFHMLKESADAGIVHEPLTIKQHTPLTAECCCKIVGEIDFILRISALGESIITEFQQMMKDPDAFVFRTNKAPSMFQCKRVEGDDPNFCMVGSLYETTTLEDPEVVDNATKKIEICTELQSCGVGKQSADKTCEHTSAETKEPKQKVYPIDKIRMGDITGPCGNTNCPLAHKVKTYIRALDTYKQAAADKVTETKDNTTKKICGACGCKDDRYHREECPEKSNQEKNKSLCKGCGGLTKAGETCEDRELKGNGTGVTPLVSKTHVAKHVAEHVTEHVTEHVAYVFNVTKVPDFKESMYGRDFLEENLAANHSYNLASSGASSSRPTGCGCMRRYVTPVQIPMSSSNSAPDTRTAQNALSTRSMGTNCPVVYNANVQETRKNVPVYNCTVISDDKDCKCDPPKPSAPCRTFDCDCIAEVKNIAARKAHKPYCPSYKHKTNCPVNITLEDEDMKKQEDEDDEAELLPYGLPPITLGPCPVMGRPCANADGFARMYKNAALPALPPSYSEAGKVCCSKEYERIKKAIKDYMKNEKEHDYRCINKFNVDTERRCCDKEQRLFSLTGRSCCGSHKMAIQEKFKEEKK